jgi:hypothetical protein
MRPGWRAELAVVGLVAGAAIASACAGMSTSKPPSNPTTTVARRTAPGSTAHATKTTPTTRAAKPARPARPGPAPGVVRAAPEKLVPLVVAAASHQDSYNRDADFGGWIDVDGDCQNTRAEVLIAESRAPVTFTRRSDCTVATGLWRDPWSGITTTTAHAFDIDHTVPLANAWRSGAWAWSPARRVAYANDLADPGHLIAIDASENREKGDDGPDAWRPPNPRSWCRYAITWDRIKAKWRLTATAAEWTALVQMAATC